MPTLLRDRARPDEPDGEPSERPRRGRRVDPRIDARRQQVRLARRRRRRHWYLGLVVVLTLLAALFGVSRSSLLAVHAVDAQGQSHTSADDIRRTAGIPIGSHLLDVDVDEIGARVEALPWVEHAHVERRWPQTVSIDVQERVGRALIADGHGGWLLIDAHGRVLGPTPDIIPTYAAHVLGVPPAPPGAFADPRVAGALAIATLFTPSLGGRVGALQVAPDGTVALDLRPRGRALLGRPDDVPDKKIRALQTVLAQVDLHDLCTLDLRVPDAPVLTRSGC